MSDAHQVQSTNYTVEMVAEILHLDSERVKGKREYHGANPLGGPDNATEDGFILYQEGNAYDRKSNTKYTSAEVADMAGIDKLEYEPCAQYSSLNHRPSTSSKNGSQPALIDDVDQKPTVVTKTKAAKKFDKRTIKDRGIRYETTQHFGIEEKPGNNLGLQSSYVEYPTFLPDGTPGRSRQKFYDPVEAGEVLNRNKKSMKYRWVPGDNDPEPKTYNLNNIGNSIEVWIVGGEVDVWCMSQAGFKAVSGFGESRHLDKIVDDLEKLGIQKIHICLDNDETGHKSSIRLAEICEEKSIDFQIYVIKGIVNDGRDVSDYYEYCEFDQKRFQKAMTHLPRATVKTLEDWQNGTESESTNKEGKKASPASKDKSREEKLAKAETLVGMLWNCQIFYTADEEYYIDLMGSDGVTRTYSMDDSKLSARLFHIFYEKTGKAIDSSVVDNALNVLRGKALQTGLMQDVWIRTGEHEEHIYVDLNTNDNQVVKIGPDCMDGWEIINNPPIKFRRPKGLYPMPIPHRDGDINKLREIINAEEEINWTMMISWLIYALHPPKSPYPVLCINGEQGTAKSTACKILRRIVDPNFTSLIGSSIREERDLAIMARNCHVIGFDNVTKLQNWQSDALCQLVTEGSFRTRKLRTDQEEILFSARRPIIINGIEALIGREDFQNRSLVCTLPVIKESKRRDEEEVWDYFVQIWPEILGFVFTAMSVSLKNYNEVKIGRMPRMADFYKWVIACESMLPWSQGSFKDYYKENQQSISVMSVESNPLGLEIERLAMKNGFIEATATDLLSMLNNHALLESRESRIWPKSPNNITTTLNRLAQNLRAVGIDVQTGLRSGAAGTRIIKIRKMDKSELR